MNDRDIQTLCLYLKKQKRTVEEYQWQHYDEQCNLLEQLLRQVFLCLECEAGKGSEAVVAQLQQMPDGNRIRWTTEDDGYVAHPEKAPPMVG
jgi:hypothetical protein